MGKHASSLLLVDPLAASDDENDEPDEFRDGGGAGGCCLHLLDTMRSMTSSISTSLAWCLLPGVFFFEESDDKSGGWGDDPDDAEEEEEEEEDWPDDDDDESHRCRISSHSCNPVFTNSSGEGVGFFDSSIGASSVSPSSMAWTSSVAASIVGSLAGV